MKSLFQNKYSRSSISRFTDATLEEVKRFQSRPLDLYFMTRNKSLNEDDTIAFLEQLLLEIEEFLYIFWGNIMIHRSEKVKLFLFDQSNRLITRRIPAYSPELNPDEYVWDMLKYQELSNFCPTSEEELTTTVTNTMTKLKNDHERIRKGNEGIETSSTCLNVNGLTQSRIKRCLH